MRPPDFDRWDRTPVHAQIEAWLREAIGRWLDGYDDPEFPVDKRRRIPTEDWLVGQFHVDERDGGRNSLREALRAIRDDGIVTTLPGKGTYIDGERRQP